MSILVLSAAIGDTDNSLNCVQCKTSGFRCGVNEVFAILGSYASFVGPLFDSQVVVQ